MSYISVRNSYKKSSKLLAIISHNNREYKIDYLVHNQIKDFNIIKQKQINLILENIKNDNLTEEKTEALFLEIEKLESQKLKFEDFPQHQKLENHTHNDLKTQFNKYYEEMKIINKKNKGHTKKEGNHLIEQVISLSNEEAEKLLKLPNGRELIIKRFNQLHEEMGQKLGIKPLNYTLHLDEGHINENNEFKLNVHAHLTYLNFNFEKEKALWCDLKKSDFSESQDLAGNIFKDIGFIRGIKKDVSNSEHLQRDEFIKSKQNSTLLKITENEIKINELAEEIQLYKNEKLKITADINLTSQEKKVEHKKLQEEIKKLQGERKLLITSKKKLDKIIVKKVNDVFKNNTKINDWTPNKIDYEGIQKDLIKEFKLIYKIDAQLEEIEKLKILLKQSESQNQIKDELIEDLKNEVKEVKEEVLIDSHKNTLKKEELQKQEQSHQDMKMKVKNKGLEIIKKDSFINKNIPKLRSSLSKNRKQEKIIKEQKSIIKELSKKDNSINL